jgi:type IV pilus assembly protein PilW
MAGFSLVEIMVAILVSLFLLTGVLQLYLGNQQTSRLGSGVSEIEQTGRFALNELSGNLRMAAFQGCADANRVAANVLARNAPTTTLATSAILGFSVTTGGSWTGGRIPINWVGAVPLAGSDVLQIQGGSRSVSNLASAMSSASANVPLASNPDNLTAGEMAIIADCTAADLIRITSVTGGLTLVYSIADNTQTTLSKAYTNTTGLNAAQAMRFNSWVYFVRDSGRDAADGSAIFSLYRLDTSRQNQAAQELVEGVERLRVLYGERSGTDAIRYRAAANVTDWSQVVAVRVALLAASRDPVLEAADTATYTLLDQSVAKAGTSGATLTYPNDQRLRRVFTASANVRNRRDL